MLPAPVMARTLIVGLAAATCSLLAPTLARAEPAPRTLSDRPASVGSVGAAGSATVPVLTWQDCGEPYRCASAPVPLDWSRPRGTTISLALVKLPATRPGARIGTIFVNPGGPGGSGVDMVRSGADLLPAAVRARFDIVGFDPRFVGSSRPAASCMNDETFYSTLFTQPPFPVTSAEEAAYTTVQAGYAERCASRSQLGFSSTASVARDLDLLRRAVGDQALTFVGYSYGTFIGQVYGQLFPGTVRAMVLDGVLDGRAWISGAGQEWQTTPFSIRVGSAEASSEALAEFFRLCGLAGTSRCALNAQGNPAATFEAIAQDLAAEPVPLDENVVLDYPTLVTAMSSVLYSPGYWAAFAAELQSLYLELGDRPAGAVASPSVTAGRVAASHAGRASVAPRLAAVARRVLERTDQTGDRPVMPTLATPGVLPAEVHIVKPLPSRPEPVPSWTPADNPTAAFAAVTCADTLNPSDESAWADAARTADAASPYFGRAWTWSSVLCATWPLRDPNAYRGPIGAKLSAPLLVIGNRYDPATPYRAAVLTAKRYSGSRLLTVQGYGHTSSAMPSACVAAALSRYLVELRLPPGSATCAQDEAPFSP